MRLVQLIHKTKGRKVAKVEEPNLRLLNGYDSVYELAIAALQVDRALTKIIVKSLSEELFDYDSIYEGKSDWKLLPAFDHPSDVTKLMLSGTGLTHKASAENRQKMHEVSAEATLTDSMKIYLWGLEGGHPTKGATGVQPEWFYKGNGAILKAHGDPLLIPSYANDGGEEPEIAGIYTIDKGGNPWRIGFATANEFSDHVMERKNYLYLAPSKIRNCSLGPELVLTDDFKDISGKVSILRNGNVCWEQNIKTGEMNMSHSLDNLEYHHFKYDSHRIPESGHIHFFGAAAFSFGAQMVLQNEDIMVVTWAGMGRPLKNVLKHAQKADFQIKSFN